jgi:hypothetical protein
LVNEQIPQIDAGETTGGKPDEVASDSEDDISGKKFTVIVEKPEPNGVKISKKNCCIIELKEGLKNTEANIEHTKMIEFFVAAKNPTWYTQFI